ncbi:MAG: outer membrane protein assembly factor BamD, partial [Magnetospirillum sp.]|nr:outer membrane protein assembly factor BamD [Magnetospirillum sp.]
MRHFLVLDRSPLALVLAAVLAVGLGACADKKPEYVER